MNFTEVFVALISHASWPITIIAIAFMFRGEVRSMFNRIRSVDSKYLKADLSSDQSFDALVRAEGMADGLELPLPVHSKSTPGNKLEEDVKSLMKRAAKKPSATLSDTWDDTEAAIGAFLESRMGRRPSSIDLMAAAEMHFEKRMYKLITLLSGIVTEQCGRSPETISKDFAFRFIKLSSRVILGIQKLQENSSPNETAGLHAAMPRSSTSGSIR